MTITVNTRILSAKLTGAQRYLSEILDRIGGLETVEPRLPSWARGMRGHAWEQIYLPRRVKGTLWSPSNSGPIFKHDQILSILDVVPLEHPEWVGKQFAQWYQVMMPKVARSAAHIITISEFSKSRIVKFCNVDPDKITVAYCGVDKRFGATKDADALLAREQLKIRYKRYVLMVGSIEPRKNIERVINAWANLEKQLPSDVGLLIAGAHGAEQVFGKFNLSNTASRLHFTGHVADSLLAGLYKGAELFIYPSLYEGFGLPIVEAMMAGTPVVCGNLTACVEVAAGAALTIDPYSVNAIQNAMSLLLNDATARLELTIAGKARSAKFNWEDSASIHKNVFSRFS